MDTEFLAPVTPKEYDDQHTIPLIKVQDLCFAQLEGERVGTIPCLLLRLDRDGRCVDRGVVKDFFVE